MFISQAFAQTAETTAQVAESGLPAGMSLMIQIALIFLILYMMILRPQQKRMKEHQMRLNAIVKGNQVIVSGIKGKVTNIKDDDLTVEVAKGVEITVIRDYVTQVIGDNNVSANNQETKNNKK